MKSDKQQKSRFQIDSLEERIAPSGHCEVLRGLVEAGTPTLPDAASDTAGAHAGGGLNTALDAAGCGDDGVIIEPA